MIGVGHVSPQRTTKAPNGPNPDGAFVVSTEVNTSMDLDALVTATEAETALAPIATITRHTIGMWRSAGWVNEHGDREHLHVHGHRGRSPLYRWGDILRAERDTRESGKSHRGRRPQAA